MKPLLSFIIVILLFLFYNCNQTTRTDWETWYEKSGCTQTPRYDETVDYCKALADASPWVIYRSFGASPQGRELPLVIVDKNRNFTPEKVKKSGNLVVLLEAGIHPGEIDGKDAGLMFVRDLVIEKKFPEFLDHITLLFIPIFNVDGHERFGPYNRINQNGPEEMGWRTTAQNLNLNRDFLKADAPEMQDWLYLFQAWLPDFFIDVHATDGADYQYVVTYILETHENIDPGLRGWTKENLILWIETEMEHAGYLTGPYVYFRTWFDPLSGLQDFPASPRYSQGYSTVQNRVGIVVENHMLKDYKTRVTATYELYRVLCELLVKEKKNLMELNKQADQTCSNDAFRNKAFPLNFENTSDSVMVEFKGVEYDIVTSDLTGGNWYQYKADNPTTFEIPLFDQQVVTDSVFLPDAYIVPPEWTCITNKLDMHGIRYSVLQEPRTIKVSTYKFSNPRWTRTPYEGRFRVSFDQEEIELEQEFPKGSVIIDMNQRTARVIANMLEPKAPDSYLSWGDFNTIFEQKEYSETYVMEAMAREMLENDPDLQTEFNQWKAGNPNLANIPWYQLNWFFSKTPWWDEKKDVYPVGRIMKREE